MSLRMGASKTLLKLSFCVLLKAGTSSGYMTVQREHIFLKKFFRIHFYIV